MISRNIRLSNVSEDSKVIRVAAARPNFMKIAPLISAINKFNNSINPNNGKAQVARAQGVNEKDQINEIDQKDSMNPSNSLTR